MLTGTGCAIASRASRPLSGTSTNAYTQSGPHKAAAPPPPPLTHADVAGGHVLDPADVAVQLRHEGLAEAHHLGVALAWRGGVRAGGWGAAFVTVGMVPWHPLLFAGRGHEAAAERLGRARRWVGFGSMSGFMGLQCACTGAHPATTRRPACPAGVVAHPWGQSPTRPCRRPWAAW